MKLIQILQNKKLKGFFTRSYEWLKSSFALFGFVTFIFFWYLIFMLASLGMGSTNVKPIEPNTTVFYRFSAEIPEDENKMSFTRDLLTDIKSFYDLTFAFKKVAEDKNITTFIADIDNADFSYAQIQELRDLIKQMRTEGKKTIAFASDFGASSNAMRKYYLATAFDKIYMQPIGSLAINGIGAEIPFVKNLLNKMGVEADFVRVGKYKNYPETLDRDSLSAEAREMLQSIIKNLSTQMVEDIASDRNISKPDLLSLINKGFYSDDEALELKLIDELAYLTELLGTDSVKLSDYLVSIESSGGLFSIKKNKPEVNIPRVAFVVAEGKILEKGRDNITARSFIKTFTEILDDDEIEAVILRIDSPGGSAVISETIRNEIIRARNKGKKVVVSMSGTVASGGYWIASAADKIIASPATLTGSIGVFGGKFVLRDLWDKLGVNWDRITFGDSAAMWSANQSFTDEQKQQLQAVMNATYNKFIARVTEGRNLTKAEVEKAAQGRVWTGKQALDYKLVDELGGISKAIDIVKLELGLTIDDKILLEKFPAQKTGFEKILDILDSEASVLSNIIHSDFIQLISSIKFNQEISLY